MKRTVFSLFIVLIIFSAYSCVLEPEKTEKIKVINRTDEDVVIYYYDFLHIKSTLTTIHSQGEIFIFVSPGVEYHAEGEISKKDYGSGRFSEVPSRWDVQQTWVIKSPGP